MSMLCLSELVALFLPLHVCEILRNLCPNVMKEMKVLLSQTALVQLFMPLLSVTAATPDQQPTFTMDLEIQKSAVTQLCNISPSAI